MNTCDTCKHWKQFEICRYNPHGHGACLHPKVSENGRKFVDGACDGEEYQGISTGPKFGCIHHEVK